MVSRISDNLVLDNLNLVSNIDQEQASQDATHFQRYSEKFKTLNAKGELYHPENPGEVSSRASNSGNVFAKNFSL